VSALAPTLQAFFTDRLIRQRHASGHTIAAYRDTLRLLLGYAATRTGLPPSRLDLVDLDAPLIASFLDHLEHERGNSIRTRNARLAAIHSLFRFAALAHPEHAESISRVLAIPPKRFDRALITYLTEPEVDELLGSCDQATWTGRRDHALLLLAVQTGLRISELIGLTLRDVHLGPGSHVACHGKGRKDRITPLTGSTVAVLRDWLGEHRGDPDAPLFPTRRGNKLSRDAIEHRLARYAAQAAAGCPSLRGKTITAHVLRHTTAMRLLHAGIDTSVIALWLGHVSVDTTQIYLHADLKLKEQALARTRPPHGRTGRYQPPDSLLAWLEGL
jgi:site-specific recombinase XerD